MNKGELMKTKFTEDQLKHIDASLPTDIYRKYEGDSYYMVMDYNSNPLGELVDMRKVKDLDSKCENCDFDMGEGYENNGASEDGICRICGHDDGMKVDDITFSEVLSWKKRLVSRYLKDGYLSEYQCFSVTSEKKWDTQTDMLKAMSFMKHYLPKGMQWNLATYEELIR